MNEQVAQEILDTLFSSLEDLETRNSALFQLLQAKGIVSEEELTPHIEQAGKAASVRWRAARVRIEHLLTGALREKEAAAKSQDKSEEQKGPVAGEQKAKDSSQTLQKKAQPGEDSDVKPELKNIGDKAKKAPAADDNEGNLGPGDKKPMATGT